MLRFSHVGMGLYIKLAIMQLKNILGSPSFPTFASSTLPRIIFPFLSGIAY